MFPISIISQYGNIVLSPPKIKQVSSGGNTIGILYDNGELYTRGNGNFYRLGTGSTSSVTTNWYLSNTNVRLFYTADFGSIVVKNDNTIWYVGCKSAITASTTTNTYYTVWTDVTSSFSSIDISTIQDIKIAGYSIMVLVQNGNLYGLGYSYSYELGLSKTQWTTLDLAFTGVKTIFAMNGATGFINNSGIMYRSGNSTNYSLGSGSNLVSYTAFSNPTGYTVQDYTLGTQASMILLKNTAGNTMVYAAGTNTGILGTNSSSSLSTYTRITALDNVFSSLKIVGSSITTFNFGLGIGSTGGIYSSGAGTNYARGTGYTATDSMYSKNVSGYTTQNPDTVLGITPASTFGTFMNISGKLYHTGQGVGTTFGLVTKSRFSLTEDMPY